MNYEGYKDSIFCVCPHLPYSQKCEICLDVAYNGKHELTTFITDFKTGEPCPRYKWELECPLWDIRELMFGERKVSEPFNEAHIKRFKNIKTALRLGRIK